MQYELRVYEALYYVDGDDFQLIAEAPQEPQTDDEWDARIDMIESLYELRNEGSDHRIIPVIK